MSDLETFRAEVRSWLKQTCRREMRRPSLNEDDICWGGRKPSFQSEAQRVWLERMGERGWTVPEWPRQYGGGGLSRQEAKVLREELARLHCRAPLTSFGIWMLGPALLKYGSEAHKRQHLPDIARGNIRWCQGYSEPNAGSDLASLQTRAEDKGDHWLVNGQKIWTSGAQYADWCYCLVRTDPKAKKHEGISFMMIDMRSHGVKVRPILLINGTSPFCETFFTDVKVPKENQWGPLNGGWTVGKRLLQFERDSISAGLGAGNIGAPGAAMAVEDY